jgi:hypothetical protein
MCRSYCLHLQGGKVSQSRNRREPRSENRPATISMEEKLKNAKQKKRRERNHN